MKWKLIIAKIGLFLTLGISVSLMISIFVVTFGYVFEEENGFYSTEMFSDEVDYWLNQVIFEEINSGNLNHGVMLKQSEEVYYLTKYGDLFHQQETELQNNKEKISWEEAKEKGGEVVTWGEIISEYPYIEDNVKNGKDEGERFYYFYDEFRQQALANLNYRFEDPTQDNIKNYVYLTKEEYFALLEKYGVKNVNGAIAPDSAESAMVYAYGKGILSYNFDSSADLNEFFILTYNGCEFSYAVEDIENADGFYFVSDQLAWSSERDFERSLITTPFSTVVEPLFYMALQETIESNNYDYLYTFADLNEMMYSITTKDGAVIGKSLDTISKKADKLITIDVTNEKLDGKSQKDVENGELKLPDTIYDTLNRVNIESITIGINESVTNSIMGLYRLLFAVKQHVVAVVITFFLTLAASIILFIMVWKMSVRRKRDYFDKLLFEVRSILCIGIDIFCIVLLVFLLEELLRYQRNYVFAFLIAVFMFVPIYFVTLEYFFSIVRNISGGNVINHFLLRRIWKKSRSLYNEFSKNWTVALHALLFVAGYLIINIFLFFILWLFIDSPILLLVLVALICENVYVMHRVYQDMQNMDTIIEGIYKITGGDLSYKIDEGEMKGHKKKLAKGINHIGEGLEKAVAVSLKDERLKAELITNVSHDIKTPLTSIINYVDLIKRENIKEEPLKGYVDVLDQKSMRLKQLIEDLVEASKASTGNIDLQCVKLNMNELLAQTIGEFEDKFLEKGLTMVPSIDEVENVIFADGRRCYRIIENLFQNVYKYSLENTRVYVELKDQGENVSFCIKNISKNPLNMEVGDLTKRFVRGEESRTTEGSGLGLSIAKSLTELQNGTFAVELDGDLFKVIVTFPKIEQ